MSRIHFIGGEKGGVGKSVLARLLAQYFIDRETPFQAFDADLSHGAMMRYYADYSEPVNIADFEFADRIVEQAAESGNDTIVDLAAQASKPLSTWIHESGLLDLAEELDLNLTFWHVMDDGSDSIKLLQNLLESYSDNPDYILARNFGRGSDFSPFNTSEVASTAEKYGAQIVESSPLHAPTMRKIDHINASFWAAANNTDSHLGPVLGLLERQRVKTWLKRNYEQFDRVLK